MQDNFVILRTIISPHLGCARHALVYLKTILKVRLFISCNPAYMTSEMAIQNIRFANYLRLENFNPPVDARFVGIDSGLDTDGVNAKISRALRPVSILMGRIHI